MSTVRLLRAAFAAVLLIYGSANLDAQTVTATISGFTTDPSGAVVPGARIVADNVLTGLHMEALSGADGHYILPLLPAGRYTMTIEKPGFTKQTVEEFVLQLGERRELSVQLTLGTQAESVTVTTDAAQITMKTESGERSDVLTHRQINDIAMNGRNTFDLLKLIPGYISTVNGQVANDSAAAWNVNGTRNTDKQMTVDGVSNVIEGAQNRVQVTVNPDAVSEVQVLTSNFQAEYGKAGGSIVQYTTRSGSKAFHADGRFFHRHDDLNANNFFNNTTGLQRPLYRYNYFGYDVGGPILLPFTHYNRSRDKLFFFWNQEFFKQFIPRPAQYIQVPTANERAGNFASSVDGNGNPVLIVDPLSTGNCSGTTHACFPGNVIPANRLSPIGQSLLKIIPLPNGVAGGNHFNYGFQGSGNDDRREDILRLDWNATDRIRVSGHYIDTRDTSVSPYPISTSQPANILYNWPLTTITSQLQPKNVSVNVVTSITPSLLNETTFGYSTAWTSVNAPAGAFSRSTYGVNVPLVFPNTDLAAAIPGMTYGSLPNQTLPSFSGLTALPNIIPNPVYTFTTAFSKNHLGHNMKAGLSYIHSRFDSPALSTNTNGTIGFANDAQNAFNTGDPFATALLGYYDTFTQNNKAAFTSGIATTVELYLQDNWKVTKHLTLDYGMRVSFIPPQHDALNQEGAFDPAQFNFKQAVHLYTPILVGGQRRAVDPANVPAQPTAANTFPNSYIGLVVPGSGSPTNGLVTRKDGLPPGAINSRGAQWGPRFGFAWSPGSNSKTVVRGGFGISYDRVQFNALNRYTQGYPNVIPTSLFYGSLSEIGSQGGVVGPPAAQSAARDGHIPNTYSFSLGVQRNLGWGTVLDAAYVGTLPRHLAQAYNLNTIPYLTTFQRSAQDPTLFPGGIVPAVEANLPAVYTRAGFPYSGANALPANFLRPYPGYGAITYTEYTGSSNYNSLQLNLKRQTYRGITFGVVYTYSKCMATASADFGATNPYNTRAYNYGPCAWDVTHTLAAHYVYDLPKVSRYLGGGRVAHAAVDGWQISGVSQFYTGIPAALGLAINGVNTGQRISGSYDLTPGLYRVGGASMKTSTLQINPEAFYPQTVGDNAPTPLGYLRQPGYVNHDLSIFKNVPVWGERHLQFRVEMFNFLNATEFNGINGGTQLVTSTGQIGNAIFGQYPNVSVTNNLRQAGSTAPLGSYFGEFSSARDPRIIQLGVKLYF
jgi:hypothetical protein